MYGEVDIGGAVLHEVIDATDVVARGFAKDDACDARDARRRLLSQREEIDAAAR